jgi:hypothetical protein
MQNSDLGDKGKRLIQEIGRQIFVDGVPRLHGQYGGRSAVADGFFERQA